jgi:hypothetical protein
MIEEGSKHDGDRSLTVWRRYMQKRLALTLNLTCDKGEEYANSESTVLWSDVESHLYRWGVLTVSG